MAQGDWRELEKSVDLSHATAATVLGDTVYVVNGGRLYSMNVTTGACLPLGSEAWDTCHMAAACNRLITLEEDGSLYRVDPRTGRSQKVGFGWEHATAAAGLGNRLYAVAGGTLYVVNPEDGSFEAVCKDTVCTDLLATVGHQLVCVDDGGMMVRVDPATGAHRELESGWVDALALAGNQECIYAVADGSLFTVDPETGSFEQLGEQVWNSRFLLCVGHHVVSLEESGRVFVIDTR